MKYGAANYYDRPLETYVRRSSSPLQRHKGSPWHDMHFSKSGEHVIDVTPDELLTRFTSSHIRRFLTGLSVGHLVVSKAAVERFDAIGQRAPVIAVPVDENDMRIDTAPPLDLKMRGWGSQSAGSLPELRTFSPSIEVGQADSGQMQLRFTDLR